MHPHRWSARDLTYVVVLGMKSTSVGPSSDAACHGGTTLSAARSNRRYPRRDEHPHRCPRAVQISAFSLQVLAPRMHAAVPPRMSASSQEDEPVCPIARRPPGEYCQPGAGERIESGAMKR